MTFLRIGSKLIQLDRISFVDLADESPLTSPATPPRVAVVVGRHRHVFKGERAEALRAFFADPKAYTRMPIGYTVATIIDITPAEVEVAS
jgi:hypothetical protein